VGRKVILLNREGYIHVEKGKKYKSPRRESETDGGELSEKSCKD